MEFPNVDENKLKGAAINELEYVVNNFELI